MDKKGAIYEMFYPSGQKRCYLFLLFPINFGLQLDLCIIRQNGSRLCWRATYQG